MFAAVVPGVEELSQLSVAGAVLWVVWRMWLGYATLARKRLEHEMARAELDARSRSGAAELAIRERADERESRGGLATAIDRLTTSIAELRIEVVELRRDIAAKHGNVRRLQEEVKKLACYPCGAVDGT